MTGTAAGFGIIGLIVAVFVLILIVLWILMPFAIFGTKDRLDTLIKEIREQNRLLGEMRDILNKIG